MNYSLASIKRISITKWILALPLEMKSGDSMAYIPDSGDIVWITFNPQAGHEQAGRQSSFSFISSRL